MKRTTVIIHNCKWKGNASHSLDLFVSPHRTVFVAMQAAAKHVEFQLPNGHSRMGYLLNSIEYEDATVEDDDGPAGKLNDFEAAAAHIPPKCPVTKW